MVIVHRLGQEFGFRETEFRMQGLIGEDGGWKSEEFPKRDVK